MPMDCASAAVDAISEPMTTNESIRFTDTSSKIDATSCFPQHVLKTIAKPEFPFGGEEHTVGGVHLEAAFHERPHADAGIALTHLWQ